MQTLLKSHSKLDVSGSLFELFDYLIIDINAKNGTCNYSVNLINFVIFSRLWKSVDSVSILEN